MEIDIEGILTKVADQARENALLIGRNVALEKQVKAQAEEIEKLKAPSE